MKPIHAIRISVGCVAVALSLSAIDVACGQADQPTLDDLLDLTPEATQNDTTESVDPFDSVETTTQETRDGLNDSIEQALSASDAVDAFEQAVNEMDDVSRRLGRGLDPGIETQRVQESILRKLDQVIQAAKDQSQGGGGGSGQPRDQDQGAQELAQQQAGAGGSQAQSSGTQSSTGVSSGTPIEPENQDAAIEQLRKEWGVLPPRVRDELSDGLRERFSPLYRSMTEAYYKALAEQE